jgi:uncharacterized protein YbjT (DUF2867 family)
MVMTTHANEILVLGATGKTGRRLVRRLRAAGETVRAASRSGEVPFDWYEPATWQAALTGASAVYVVAPENDPAPAHDFVKQAVERGVTRFVVLSARGIEHVDERFGRGMVAVEDAVRESGTEWTVIRPNNFNQNFDEGLWQPALLHGRLALPVGDLPEPFVDAEDVAEVAARLLTREGHAGKVYELSGPRALSFEDAVATIAQSATRTIQYVSLTPEEYHAELLTQGYPEDAAETLGAVFAVLGAGHIAEPVEGVQRVLGRPPTDFAAYVSRAVGAGAWA